MADALFIRESLLLILKEEDRSDQEGEEEEEEENEGETSGSGSDGENTEESLLESDIDDDARCYRFKRHVLVV